MALSLVLAAALIHASWNLLVKQVGGDIKFALLTSTLISVVWTSVGLWFAWSEVPGYGPLHWSLIGASGAVHVVYYVLQLRDYGNGDLSVVCPLARGSAPLLTAAVATVLLGESLGARGWAGVAGVLGGIALIAGGHRLLRAWRAGAAAAAEQLRLRASVGYGLATGVFIAGYYGDRRLCGQTCRHVANRIEHLGNLVRVPLLALWAAALARQNAEPLRVTTGGRGCARRSSSRCWRRLPARWCCSR